MTLEDGCKAAQALHQEDKLVVEACLPYTPNQLHSGALCTQACSRQPPELLLGQLDIVPLSTIWTMQQHIREHGSIMCRMELYRSDGQAELRRLYATGARGVYRATGGQPTQRPVITSALDPDVCLLPIT
jgi:hypothetical protein